MLTKLIEMFQKYAFMSGLRYNNNNNNNNNMIHVYKINHDIFLPICFLEKGADNLDIAPDLVKYPRVVVVVRCYMVYEVLRALPLNWLDMKDGRLLFCPLQTSIKLLSQHCTVCTYSYNSEINHINLATY